MKKFIILSGYIFNIGDKFISDSLNSYITSNFKAEVEIVKRDEYKKFLGQKSVQFIIPGGPWIMNNFSNNFFDFNILIEDILNNKQKIYLLGGGLNPKIAITKPIEERTLDNLKKINSYSSLSTRSTSANKFLESNGLNATMTGCCVWYNNFLNKEFEDNNRLLISDPGFLNKKRVVNTLLSCLFLIFQIVLYKEPRSRYFMFNRFISSFKDSPILYVLQRVLILFLKLFKFKIIYGNKNDINIYELLNGFQAHIGFRVHSHLIFLANKKNSLLLSEDIRGVNQNLTFNSSKNFKLIRKSLKTKSLIKNHNPNIIIWESTKKANKVMRDHEKQFKLHISKIINN
jgi:hypothetical protein